MSCLFVDPENYSSQLQQKVARFEESLKSLNCDLPEIEVFDSARRHYRMRAEFKIWQDENGAHYAMFEPGSKHRPIYIESFEVACKAIYQLMNPLMEQINRQDMLRHKLFQIEFLATQTGEVLVSMIYHKQLGDDWSAVATELQSQFGIYVIGRSRKQKIVLSQDFVTETLNVGTEAYRYQQVEGGFTQPNAGVCEKMLAWAKTASAKSASDEHQTGDLLELYCGNGNFTIPLSKHFSKVLATEISKTSVKSALINIEKNQVGNIQIARMSSEELTQAMRGDRQFRRLKEIDLGDYQFSTVFVDPPRAGLDDATLEMIQAFPDILYISCNPVTLIENLGQLLKTHQLCKLAVFDQFPYTDHLECGVYLSRI